MRTHAILCGCLATVLGAGTLAAQGPSFQTFGSGCVYNQQALFIGNQGLPVLGTMFQITYTGPNTNNGTAAQQILWPHLVLGFSRVTTPIPQGLLPQQPAGCQGLISPDVVIPAAPWIGRGIFHDTMDINLPNNPALLGLTFQAQWLTTFEQCGFAGCNLVGLLTSDGATIVIG